MGICSEAEEKDSKTITQDKTSTNQSKKGSPSKPAKSPRVKQVNRSSEKLKESLVKKIQSKTQEQEKIFSAQQEQEKERQRIIQAEKDLKDLQEKNEHEKEESLKKLQAEAELKAKKEIEEMKRLERLEAKRIEKEIEMAKKNQHRKQVEQGQKNKEKEEKLEADRLRMASKIQSHSQVIDDRSSKELAHGSVKFTDGKAMSKLHKKFEDMADNVEHVDFAIDAGSSIIESAADNVHRGTRPKSIKKLKNPFDNLAKEMDDQEQPRARQTEKIKSAFTNKFEGNLSPKKTLKRPVTQKIRKSVEMEKLGKLININANRGQEGLEAQQKAMEKVESSIMSKIQEKVSEEQAKDPDFDPFKHEAMKKAQGTEQEIALPRISDLQERTRSKQTNEVEFEDSESHSD